MGNSDILNRPAIITRRQFLTHTLCGAALVGGGCAASREAGGLAAPWSRQPVAYEARQGFVFDAKAPFTQCHASTLAEMPDGSLLCAWFAGTQEGHTDTAIWGARCTEAGWTSPECLADLGPLPHWNPVLFHDPERGVFLFFKVGKEIPRWSTFWMHTKSGAAWSAPRELVPGDEGGRGPVKNKPIILQDGAWLAGASTEQGPRMAFADRSEDGGHTWRRSADWPYNPDVITGSGVIQPTLWESAPGHVHALMRTSAGRIGECHSFDGGYSWSDISLTGLPNPNSGIDLVRLAGGELVLAYNDSSLHRSPLSLALSRNSGRTWQALGQVEAGPGKFSYPSVIATRKALVLSYTWNRRRIRCWRIPFDTLLQSSHA